jgi:transcriptional regulator with XRE-family HTH domain
MIIWKWGENVDKERTIKNIVALMGDQGMTSEQLSNKSGISETSISNILTGKTIKPKGKTLGKIAKALGVATEQLL